MASFSAQGHITVTRARKGADGRGISGVTSTYARSNVYSVASETTEPAINGSWSTTIPELTADYPYLWKKEVTAYTDGTTETRYSLMAVRGGTGTGIESVVEQFGVSNTNNDEPSEYPATNQSELILYANKDLYLWRRTLITYDNATSEATGAVCLGLVSSFADATTQFSKGTVEAAGDTWADTIGAVGLSKGDYLWSRTSTAYTDQTITADAICIGYWGQDGSDGASGIVYRVSVWESGQQYLNQSAETGSGIRIVDICTAEQLQIYDSDTSKAYECQVTHTANSDIPLSTDAIDGVQYWAELSDLKVVKSALILANKIQAAYLDVDSIVAQGILATSEDGATVGIQSGTDRPFFVRDANGNIISYIDTNGKFYISGRIFAGTEGGQSVVIDPASGEDEDGKGKILITDATGTVVQQIDGETIDSLETLLPDTSGEVSLSGTYPQKQTVSNTSPLSRLLLETFSSVTATGQLTLTFDSIEISGTYTRREVSDSTPYALPSVTLRLYFGSVNFTTIRVTLGQTADAEGIHAFSKTIDSFTTSVNIQKGNSYTLRIEATLADGSNAAYTDTSAQISTTVSAVSFSAEAFLSRFFGNGFVISNATDQYIAAVMESKKLRSEEVAGNYGKRLDTSGQFALVGGMWAPQPRTLLCMRLYLTASGGVSTTNFVCKCPSGYTFTANGNTATSASAMAGRVYRSGDGLVKINFPTDWSSLNLASNGYFLTQVRTWLNSGSYRYRYAMIYDFTDTGATIVIGNQDGANVNDEYIDVELKLY